MRWCLLALLGSATAIADPDLAARAKALQAQAIVVDCPVDTPTQLVEKPADVAKRGATDHFDLIRAKEGGLTAPFFSIFVDAAFVKTDAAHRAHELIDVTLRTIDANPD